MSFSPNYYIIQVKYMRTVKYFMIFVLFIHCLMALLPNHSPKEFESSLLDRSAAPLELFNPLMFILFWPQWV